MVVTNLGLQVGIEGADLSGPAVKEGGGDIEVTVDMITAQVRAMHERELRPVPLGDLLLDEPILCATQKEEVQIGISRTFHTALSVVRRPLALAPPPVPLLPRELGIPLAKMYPFGLGTCTTGKTPQNRGWDPALSWP